MAEKPEARHVRDRVRLERTDHVGGAQVELDHRRYGGVERFRGRSAVTVRLQHDPRPERLRQEEHVTGAGARFRPDPVRMDRPDHGEAVLRLGVADRVAACQDRARSAHPLVCSREHVAEHLHGKLLGKGRDRESEEWPSSHREHVIQRVGGRDRAERAWVIDQGREEVDREDDRALVVEAVDGRVVSRVEADEEILRLRRDETGQQ